MATQNPFMDHAAPILAGEPTINDQQRADLHDAFYSKSPDELTQHLSTLAVPDDLKRKLFDAKQASMPVAPPVDKVTEAVQKMANLDPKTMDLVEAHPNLLKAFTTAATTEPKAAATPAGETSAAPKPATAGKTAKPAAAPLAPRADGQPHFPPIPDQHKRVLASDGGVHDIPEERLGDAQKIDPNLHVLNP